MRLQFLKAPRHSAFQKTLIVDLIYLFIFFSNFPSLYPMSSNAIVRPKC